MDLSNLGPSAAAVAMAVIFLRYIQSKDVSQTKRDELFAKSLEKNTDAMQAVAKATKQGNKEAKERNGHLGEQNIQLASMLHIQTAQLTGIGDTLKSSAETLKKDTKTAHDDTKTVAEVLANNTEDVRQGTDDVRDALIQTSSS